MSTNAASRVVVVGAGPAGLRTAEHLRRRGYVGRLTLIGEEPDPTYDRPALSKQFLIEQTDVEKLWLRDAAAMAALELDLRLGTRAESLDLDERAVVIEGGERLGYDALVISTGSQPARPPFTVGLDDIHYLRTAADAAALREAFAHASRVAVIGGGFVGCEVAAAARLLGLHVTLIDAMPTPLAVSLGTDIGARIGALHVERGVHVRCGVPVAEITGHPGARIVHLADGSQVDADVVVVGVGAVPTTGWLAGSGLALDGGLLCDSACRADAPGVFGAGDVARWFNPFAGEHTRVEHWTNAMEQPGVVADNVLAWLTDGSKATMRDYVSVPYFWSNQYDLRIQFAGHVRPGDTSHDEELDGLGRLVTYHRGERLVGALTLNAPRELLKVRAGLVRAATALVSEFAGGGQS